MIDLPTEILVCVRKRGKITWVDGDPVGANEKEYEFSASVQPVSKKDGSNSSIIEESLRRSKEMYKLYTTYPLFISDEENQLQADIILRDGKKFEVLHVSNWSVGTDIPHYKAIIVKQDGQGVER